MKPSQPMSKGYRPQFHLDGYCEPYNYETGPSGVEVEYWITPLGPDAFVEWKMPSLAVDDGPKMPTKREQLRACRQVELIHEFYDQMDSTRGPINSHPNKVEKLCHFCQIAKVKAAGDICPSCVSQLTAEGFEIVSTDTAEDGTRKVNLQRIKETTREKGLLGRFTVAKFMLLLSVPLLALVIGIWLVIRR